MTLAGEEDMNTLSPYAPAQPMLRSSRNNSEGPASRRTPPSAHDNVVVPGFVPPARERFAPQTPANRPGWAAGTAAQGDRMPVVVPARRNRLVAASLVFTGLGMVAAGASLWRLGASDVMLAGIASALAVVLLVLSSALAIGSLVVGISRRTGWIAPAIALLLAVASLAGALYLAAGQVLDLQLPTF
jgi:hypothetical protein